MLQRPFWQRIYDLVGAPLRLVLLPDRESTSLGLTSLERERIDAVLPLVSGRLLDVGAGPNNLVREYGNGIGVDVHDFGGGALILNDTRQLPFANESFDTVSFLASLNHIPERLQTLKEAHRVLRPRGRVIVTMLDPFLSRVGHMLWWYSEDKQRGGMHDGEVFGFWPRELRCLLRNAEFDVTHEATFVYHMNHLYVAEKRGRNDVVEAKGRTSDLA